MSPNLVTTSPISSISCRSKPNCGSRPARLLELGYIYTRKDFTSELTGDTHVGRKDRTHQGRAELQYQFTASFTGSLGFLYTQRSSTNALRDFNDSIVSIEGQYQF